VKAKRGEEVKQIGFKMTGEGIEEQEIRGNGARMRLTKK